MLQCCLRLSSVCNVGPMYCGYTVRLTENLFVEANKNDLWESNGHMIDDVT